MHIQKHIHSKSLTSNSYDKSLNPDIMSGVSQHRIIPVYTQLPATCLAAHNAYTERRESDALRSNFDYIANRSSFNSENVLYVFLHCEPEERKTVDDGYTASAYADAIYVRYKDCYACVCVCVIISRNI